VWGGGQAKAAAALCNICSETDTNRELVVRSGGLPSLIDMLLNPCAAPPPPPHTPLLLLPTQPCPSKLVLFPCFAALFLSFSSDGMSPLYTACPLCIRHVPSGYGMSPLYAACIRHVPFVYGMSPLSTACPLCMRHVYGMSPLYTACPLCIRRPPPPERTV
jgi:hypothetical protein